jgi:hypothetical protein
LTVAARHELYARRAERPAAQTEENAMTAATVTTGYVGWLRIAGGRWKRVVEGASRDEVLSALMAAADRAAGRHKDLLFNTGADPNAKPIKRTRVAGGTIDFRPAEALNR